MTTPRNYCLALDAADPLAPLREAFALPDGVIYLDGNSLGALPKATAARVQQVVQDEWGNGLIRSWNTAGWIDLAQRLGNQIARLVGTLALIVFVVGCVLLLIAPKGSRALWLLIFTFANLLAASVG